MNFSTCNALLEVVSLYSDCPYTISNGDGGKYPKQVSKSRLIDGSVNKSIIRMLHVNQNFILSHWMLRIVTSQNFKKSHIHYLCMPMNMWVKGSGYLQFSIQLIPQ
jgi:hypothetical protein